MNKYPEIGITELSGGALAPEGFVAGAAACGIREEGRLDLGLLLSERPAVAAAVFTRNRVKGAPVVVSREAVGRGRVRAVVANSGNANAATGRGGLEDARAMQRLAARELGLRPEEVAVASTGVIGERLPMERVEAGIRRAAAGLGRDGSGFAAAILTTDTRIKQAAVRVEVEGAEFTVGGTAKGSGMIHPNMGTMLAFLTTDAALEGETLRGALSRAVDRTFNRVTVDGDTSPSDMALLIANGAAGGGVLAPGSPGHAAFEEALEEVGRRLAREIARDGEGATKLLEVVVEGAPSEEDAARLARSVAGSNLVKAAVAGEDANWGRVLTALGYSGAGFDPEGVEIHFGPVLVFAGGEPVEHDISAANAALGGEEVGIRIRLSGGSAAAAAWGCDLTSRYVEINGSYRT
ncbi:Arginine biosynthesis bifunctional protein ArgJ [Rubrobacter xylanophilus DSM 9941]|uniref:bifunctional glutamate N-acetyltransferase/amino-acid acetyltransferase ArgJ n=1 Tax=Rubrobacter xylanophilus TaxID=49319 RepID=UPI001C6433DB|nr:bifunctional glutamate N-acetyltransferase/amino-acid acetyltransferase ArgJ [Rubrobacter xylanophilus]QYJ15919.1 Arginine biosynthesis bifunctional protein ArgJ [Rubrobacter xylanophilus DSM 9941]